MQISKIKVSASSIFVPGYNECMYNERCLDKIVYIFVSPYLISIDGINSALSCSLSHITSKSMHSLTRSENILLHNIQLSVQLDIWRKGQKKKHFVI